MGRVEALCTVVVRVDVDEARRELRRDLLLGRDQCVDRGKQPRRVRLRPVVAFAGRFAPFFFDLP